MAIDIDKIWIYRMIHINNLEHDLQNDLYCKNANKENPNYTPIGSAEVIGRRSTAIVKCYPDTVVNDYVPFYFSFRTPMLYNIITGMGVPAIRQENIVYLCCKLVDVAVDSHQWCYTNGNASSAITKFYNNFRHLEDWVDWKSITTTDFRDDNADGDEDRKRKKHAEFLIKYKVSVDYISKIAVLNSQKEQEVNSILQRLKLNIPVRREPNFYF